MVDSSREHDSGETFSIGTDLFAPPPAPTLSTSSPVSSLQPMSASTTPSDSQKHASPVKNERSLAFLESGNPPVAEWKPQKQEYLVILTLTVISVMVALDATILVAALEYIAIELHGSATEAFWAGTSYLLSCAVVQPFISAISDIFGRQELLFISLVLFTAASLICALADNFTVLFVGRSLQGVGGGGIITMVQVIFADIIPLRQRPKYFSFVLVGWSLGTVMGPLVGGVFAQKVTWRWVFYINFPFCGLGLVMIPLFVRLETEKSSFREKLLRVDWLGGFLFISGLTSFLVALTWGGIEFPWSSFRTLVPLIIGAAGVLLAFLWDAYQAKEPFLRKSLFYSLSAIAGYLSAVTQGIILFCGMYYVPFYFVSVRFTSHITSALNIFPVLALLVPGSAIISNLITRTGCFRPYLWLGWVVTTIGTGLFILLDVHTSKAVWATTFVIFGIGNGISLSAINFAIQTVARPEDAGRAASMYAFVRTLGMTIGVAIGGTVFQNTLKSRLRDLGLPDEIAVNAETYVRVLRQMSPTDPRRIATVEAYADGFQGVFITMTGIAGAGLLASLFIKKHSMDQLLKSEYRLSRQ